MSLLRSALLGILMLCLQAELATSARAEEQVSVEVVDIAGSHAYVRPGSSAGVHRGDTVRLGGRTYEVIASSAHSATFDRRGARLRIGARGTATTSPLAAESAARRSPRPLDTYRGQWPVASLPAASQHPKHVPLGAPETQGRAKIWLGMRNAVIVPMSGSPGPIADNELRGRLHYEPFEQTPWALDADLAVRVWIADQLKQRSGNRSRPLARVRQLQTSYGESDGFFAAAGRMPYAARTLGVLDGARAQTALGAGFTLGAFGGFVPNPLDERPDPDTTRFGVEAGYRNLEAFLRPDIAVTAQASRFAGKIDEQRLTSFVDFYPAESHLGAHAELSFFDRNNPWNAPPQQLTAAGVNGSLRLDAVELGGRFDMQRPERSRWLASYLYDGWLCTRAPALPGEDEPCRDDDARYLASLDAGLRLPTWLVRAGATRTSTANVDAEQLGGFLQAAALNVLGRLRLEAGVMGSTGSLLHTLGANCGLGSLFLKERLNLSIRYRPALSRYEADTGPFIEHMTGASLAFTPSSIFSLDLDADFITGRDVNVLLVQSLLTLRPDLSRAR